jgi:hypothetical protein
VQVEVLAVVADAVVERILEVEDLCALLRGAESECGTFVAVPEPLVVPLLRVAKGQGIPCCPAELPNPQPLFFERRCKGTPPWVGDACHSQAR